MERNLSIARLGVLLKVDCKCFRPVRHAPSQEQVLADMETIRNVAGEWLWLKFQKMTNVMFFSLKNIKFRYCHFQMETYTIINVFMLNMC